jgi:hypothetical protein
MTSEIHSPSAPRQSGSLACARMSNPTSVEHKAIDAHLLIARNADSGDQAFLVAYRCQCRHEPAIPVVPLSYVIGRRALDEELGSVEDVLSFASHQPL